MPHRVLEIVSLPGGERHFEVVPKELVEATIEERQGKGYFARDVGEYYEPEL